MRFSMSYWSVILGREFPTSQAIPQPGPPTLEVASAEKIFSGNVLWIAAQSVA